jgi:hypothetical protein
VESQHRVSLQVKEWAKAQDINDPKKWNPGLIFSVSTGHFLFPGELKMFSVAFVIYLLRVLSNL